MDYEKKYKELVGKIDKAYLYAQTDSTRAVLEEIRPELRESEDERTRKTLVAFFTDWHKTRSHCWGISVPKILAWLEKQGGQIDLVNKEYWRGYREGKQEILDKYSELEKQDEKGTNGNEREIPNSTWSEEDKRHIELLISICKEEQEAYQTGSLPYINIGEAINWLKSIKGKYTWKPSDLQIEALESATANCAYSEYEDCLTDLIEQLKKLKG